MTVHWSTQKGRTFTKVAVKLCQPQCGTASFHATRYARVIPEKRAGMPAPNKPKCPSLRSTGWVNVSDAIDSRTSKGSLERSIFKCIVRGYELQDSVRCPNILAYSVPHVMVAAPPGYLYTAFDFDSWLSESISFS